MKNVTEIKGRDVLKIQETPIVKTYQHTADDSPLKGKQYRVYTYLGKAFAVNTEDSFCQLHTKGQLASVSIDTDADGQLSLVGKTSKQQELSMAKFDAEMNYYTKTDFKPEPVSAELLNDIQ